MAHRSSCGPAFRKPNILREKIMNTIETLKYLNKKYGNNGVKFEVFTLMKILKVKKMLTT